MPDNDPTRSGTPEPDGNRTNATHVTPADEQARLAVFVGGIAVPGFEIESTLGSGSFGVVYRAKQVGLNRTIALKMLIAGPYASPTLRARFLLEAEAVAALENPHIVRVFAFGEHASHPYLAMEYVPGGTLADRVKAGGPLPPADAARAVTALAGAVAHAHSRGVVHRDIKPGNVLLSADGEPRLTDFGLAKVGRSDMTVTGQILGTPAYMAPEQAAGKVHEVGTAADVYALGAVLYDVLTGRPPFLGDSAAVTLQKVLSEEPQRLRSHNPAVPRDLETICLKCLEKDPARRYPTAQALAEDLTRYTRHEPITVRPTGPLERGYKWVKRNKVLAGAGAAVSLALLVGAGVSLGFGLEAREKRQAAETAAEGEEREKRAAVAARDEVQRKSDELRLALARALLGPLAADDRMAALTSYEADALWRVAELRRDKVATAFLEEATLTPQACEQLRCRSAYAVHAAVGLDVAARSAADQLLLERLRALRHPAQVVSLAVVASRQERPTPALAAAATGILASAVTTDADSLVRLPVVGELSLAVSRLESSQASGVCDRAAGALADALAKETNPEARRALAAGLGIVAARSGPDGVARATNVLTAALGEELTAGVRRELVAGLVTVAGKLRHGENGRVALALTVALTKERDPLTQKTLATGLAMVAAELEPAAVAKVADMLLTGLAGTDDPAFQVSLAGGLAAVSERLDANRAAKTVEALTTALTIEVSPPGHRQLVHSGLAAAAARLGPGGAEKAATALTAALAEARDPARRASQAVGLAAVASRLGTPQSAELCDRAAEALAGALIAEREPYAQRALADGLGAVSARLGEGGAEKVAVRLTTALTEEQSPNARRSLAAGMVAVAAWLGPTSAADAASVLTTALARETDSSTREALAGGLAATATRLAPPRAGKVCDRSAQVLSAALGNERGVRTRRILAESLTAVLRHTEQAGAAAQADILVAAIAREEDYGVRGSLAGGLAAVAPRLGPDRTRAAADALISALAKERGADARLPLANALAALTLGVEPASLRHSPVAVGALAPSPALLPSIMHLLPHSQARPLPPQTLVDLLKHPLCVAEARRAVLNALAFTYQHPFKDHWEFVEYAQTYQPHLDLLTPPKRPGQKP